MTVGTSNFAIAVMFVLILLVIVALILNKRLFKQLLMKFRGRTDEVMTRNAGTPEGAADFYNAAIREKEALYARADQSFREISGKLDMAEKNLFSLKKEAFQIDRDIESCLDAGRETDAKQYANRRITVDQKMKALSETIEEFKKAKSQQEEIRAAIKQELDELKEEKERTVYQLESDQHIIALHESMNASASTSESDHMLERVREGAKKQRERAAGAQIAYDSSAEALNRRMENRTREQEADNLLAEIRRRRGNT